MTDRIDLRKNLPSTGEVITMGGVERAECPCCGTVAAFVLERLRCLACGCEHDLDGSKWRKCAGPKTREGRA